MGYPGSRFPAMNAYAQLILAALVLEFLVDLVGNLLNLRALDPELPAEFSGLYDAERYARSQRYTRERTRFGLVRGALGLAVTLAFWFAGGFPWVDGLARDLGLGPVGTGLAFLGLLSVGMKVLSLPFQLWSTFVIEERYGFNRTDARTFVVDQLKGLLLGVVLGGALMGAVLWFFETAGSEAWLWCWATAAAFSLFGAFLAPTWILPLFNRFEPLEEGSLRERILTYSRSVSFPVDGLFVIDGSKRSSRANAFFTGLGKTKRIALFDTLVEQHTEDELVAVVAHEVGHYKKGHVLQGLAVGLIHLGVLFWLLGHFLDSPGLFEAFGVAEPSAHAGLVFFGMLFTPIELVLSVAMSAFSRRNEFQADAFAAETTGRPEDLVAALKKLSSENLSNLTPHPFQVWLRYSHPPVLARIEALRARA